jgi:hypothetical protein
MKYINMSQVTLDIEISLHCSFEISFMNDVTIHTSSSLTNENDRNLLK